MIQSATEQARNEKPDPITEIHKIAQDALSHGKLVGFSADDGTSLYSSFDSITLQDGDHRVQFTIIKTKKV
jgi:hypothetical protein